jgi:hypothetical protein
MQNIDILLLSQPDIMRLDLGIEEMLSAVEHAMPAEALHQAGKFIVDDIPLARAREKGMGQSFRMN